MTFAVVCCPARMAFAYPASEGKKRCSEAGCWGTYVLKGITCA